MDDAAFDARFEVMEEFAMEAVRGVRDLKESLEDVQQLRTTVSELSARLKVGGAWLWGPGS